MSQKPILPALFLKMQPCLVKNRFCSIRATANGLVKTGTRLPTPEDPDTYCGMTCGTGHGIGLEVHEPPLLDFKGPELLTGDVLTIEPGLYCQAIGGVRLEDMVVVREDSCENLNTLPEGLCWR